MAIQMRRGNSINYDPSKLRAGEFAVSQDNQKVYICITQGNVLEIATSAVIEQWITEAEAWAVGERGGVPVPVTDETYHNNSKYYSDRAEAASLNPPYIGQNGNWWVYSTVSEAYVDSGVDASITVNIADVTMLSAGSTPYVTNTGTSTDPIFHLFIPEARGIVSVTKTSTSGLNDTYTIAYSDNTTSTFTVTNGEDGEDGRSIVSITLSSRTGLVDTYTISYSDSTTSTFTVRNGNQWFNGTGVSGKSVTPTVFPSSGVSYAHEQDCYLNTTEGAVYVCVTGGIASVAEWTYKFTMSGGGSSGDMLASVYDSNGNVANAGGIEAYVESITDTKLNRSEYAVLGAKNLLKNTAKSNTVNGVTFTVNSNGSITANGTATATVDFSLFNQNVVGIRETLLNKSLILSGGVSNTAYLQFWNIDGSGTTKASKTSETTFEFTNQNANFDLSIHINSGESVSNITFYPMLRLDTDTDNTYAPYAMTNRELTESKDFWTDIATVDSSGHVTFTGLNDSYSYSNPFINDNVARVITVARSGSGTNVTLIFALDGATQGDQCKLRVFR